MEEAPGTQWLGRWMGPRVGTDKVEKRERLLPGLSVCSRNGWMIINAKWIKVWKEAVVVRFGVCLGRVE
jgi:hypothetical protein